MSQTRLIAQRQGPGSSENRQDRKIQYDPEMDTLKFQVKMLQLPILSCAGKFPLNIRPGGVQERERRRNKNSYMRKDDGEFFAKMLYNNNTHSE